ncbi:hypothetical protein [Saccharothrix sp. HUAS TT1]|uniref:hypothetical protein n=1 Tax=unclassified Saccharothrix TaxID=2593673 RepID=UPI00345B4DBD
MERPVQVPAFAVLAAVLAAFAPATADLPDGRTATSVDWAFGAANRVGLVVLLNRPLRTVVGVLSAHGLIALTGLLLAFVLHRLAATAATEGERARRPWRPSPTAAGSSGSPTCPPARCRCRRGSPTAR